jgi:hypothetical protein
MASSTTSAGTGRLGQHPRHRGGSQSAGQDPQREARQPVGPVHIVDRDHHGRASCGVFKQPADPFDQPQLPVVERRQSRESRSVDQRPRPRSQGEQERRARRDLVDLLSVAYPDHASRPRRLFHDRPQQRGFADARLAGQDDHRTGPSARGPAHRHQGRP